MLGELECLLRVGRPCAGAAERRRRVLGKESCRIIFQYKCVWPRDFILVIVSSCSCIGLCLHAVIPVETQEDHRTH